MPITLVADIFVLGLLPSAALAVLYSALCRSSLRNPYLPFCR